MLETQSAALDFSQASKVEQTARNWIFRYLEQIAIGRLTVIETFGGIDDRVRVFGQQSLEQSLDAKVEIHHPSLYARFLRGGSVAASEAYMDGWWDSPDLTAVMNLMAQNLNALDQIEQRASWFSKLALKLGHWLKRNTLDNSKKNIHAHYDLGNSLYETFLDENMLYSSALFTSEQDTLEAAQLQKMDRLCKQLDLQPTDHVIEIGTGWGAMAIYMAQQYGCRVTTTTISDEQFAYAQSKINALGLNEKITLLKKDYRLLEGQFDKLVSIEMIEAVGKAYLDSFIIKCRQLLKPQGLMALQAITIVDSRYEEYSRNVDFIQKYIFPGGFLPSVSALTFATAKQTDLVVRNLHDMGLDYAKTLHHWHQRFTLQENKVRELGYDECFIRMWRYYFCYCEGGFLARSISTVQMTFQAR